MLSVLYSCAVIEILTSRSLITEERSWPSRSLFIEKLNRVKKKNLVKPVRELRSKAIHAQGYISGEALRSIEDPSLHLVISTWKSIGDWTNWLNTPERKAFQQKIDAILEEPAKITPYEYESISPNMDEILTGLELSVQDE